MEGSINLMEGEEGVNVGSFTYLRSVVSTRERVDDEVISSVKKKVNAAFVQLYPVL